MEGTLIVISPTGLAGRLYASNLSPWKQPPAAGKTIRLPSTT